MSACHGAARPTTLDASPDGFFRSDRYEWLLPYFLK
jgi:hypothetical protein